MIKANVSREVTELEMSGDVIEILTNLTYLVSNSISRLSEATGMPEDMLKDILRHGLNYHKKMEGTENDKNRN